LGSGAEHRCSSALITHDGALARPCRWCTGPASFLWTSHLGGDEPNPGIYGDSAVRQQRCRAASAIRYILPEAQELVLSSDTVTFQCASIENAGDNC
jgi:hypothetical protein